jgi:hypothetical protein
VSESSPPFRRAQANLSAPWMALAQRPMLQQGLKCFKEFLIFNFFHDSYAKASVGLKCFKEFFF